MSSEYARGIEDTLRKESARLRKNYAETRAALVDQQADTMAAVAESLLAYENRIAELS